MHDFKNSEINNIDLTINNRNQSLKWANFISNNMHRPVKNVSKEKFQAIGKSRQFGEITSCLLKGESHTVNCGSPLYHQEKVDTQPVWQFCLQTLGNSEVRQGNKTFKLKAGDFAINNRPIPYQVKNISVAEQLVVIIPCHLIHSDILILAPILQGQAFSESPCSRLLSNFLLASKEELFKLDKKNANLLLDTILTSVRSALLETVNTDPRKHPNFLIHRVNQWVQHHIKTPKITVQEIADDLQCSKRQIFRAYENYNISLSQYIIRTRLERCREDLIYPGNTDNITTIAYRWGFSDYAHFSRKFKTH